MQNVEYKCELRDTALATAILRRLGAAHIARIEQRDTYFRVADCRLKRREAKVNGRPEPVEYIRYERADIAQSRISRYAILSETDALARYGTSVLPVMAVVEKIRELWMFDSVRVHLDEVVGLGSFLEFEAIVTPRQNVARCHARVAELKQALLPAIGEGISRSYSDMVGGEGTGGESAVDRATS